MTPYYDDGTCVIYHGDCRDILPTLDIGPEAALVTDPPYGIDYRSNHPRLDGNARSIDGDTDTAVRDAVLEWWDGRGPALVFGSWRIRRPAGARGVLVWDKGGALGSGDLSLPWKFDHEEIYVLGRSFAGKRDSGSVLRHPPVQSIGRYHPHEKPTGLMSMLLAKLPDWPVVDPCCGVGPVLEAAKARNRRAIGIELVERYCEIAAKRLAQGAFDFGAVS
jgi:DNA modification methylase